MNQVCEICSQPMKLIPPGVSKATGKSYQAFWACPTRHPKAYQAPLGGAITSPQPDKTTEVILRLDTIDSNLKGLLDGQSEIYKMLTKELGNE